MNSRSAPSRAHHSSSSSFPGLSKIWMLLHRTELEPERLHAAETLLGAGLDGRAAARAAKAEERAQAKANRAAVRKERARAAAKAAAQQGPRAKGAPTSPAPTASSSARPMS
mmetsp:Transcript_34547/g.78113  ORF Transcript_34547/g.78113 Transcript_34547/m.78113 type:complete len:112 (-) Transcript_34547:449-784(-)